MGLKDKVKSKLTRSDSVTDTPWTIEAKEAPAGQFNPSAYDANMERGTPEPTVAAFSPGQQSATTKRNAASVLIHQKSPLLVATPPQVTRALAYSHPFILPLNYLAGLTSWTSGDPWESFLLVCAFWFVVLYGDYFIRMAGPLVLIAIVIGGMYVRKLSPLSSAAWDKESRKRADSDSQQRKTLDEILETLQQFTTRCELMLDPLARMTEYLSTQNSATSQTARPTLTYMFTRILAITPVWVILTLPPLHIVTGRRVVLVIGTTLLTWHSEQARASRAIIWRSRTIRSICSIITGLNFRGVSNRGSLLISSQAAAERILSNKGLDRDVRFTFTLYENQRRWVALGYTGNLLPAEREPWTDDGLNPCPDKDYFPLPDTDHDGNKWRWVPNSEWKIDMKWSDDATKIPAEKEGWTYYDNKWRLPSKVDDWSKWTRRRRWIRDAELVELTPEEKASLSRSVSRSLTNSQSNSDPRPSLSPTEYARGDSDNFSVATATASKRRGWFGRRRSGTNEKRSMDKSAPPMPHDDVLDRYRDNYRDRPVEGVAQGLS